MESPPLNIMAQVDAMSDDLVRLARLLIVSGSHQAIPTLRKLARRYRDVAPELSKTLVALLRESPLRSISEPSSPIAQPVDTESRLPLVQQEDPVAVIRQPILPLEIRSSLEQLVNEYRDPASLVEVGLAPTRTALFVGPPGVGKTLATRWIAHQLDRPLFILDLASVMSSFLGRTGENVRRVLDHAKRTQCVLLLDELDAVAKRRDDATEIGELKRLVTVLLQEIDRWPEGSLLIAATNHSDLLDPAIWRRFEVVLDFPLPSSALISEAISDYLDGDECSISNLTFLCERYRGASFSEVERDILRARRLAVTRAIPVNDAVQLVAREHFQGRSSRDRIQHAVELAKTSGMSQRQIHELTGVSRDTLRRHLAGAPDA